MLTDDSVTDALARLVESTPGAAVAMCSHGHGRSPALAGSVTGELLRKTFGPVIVVGPRCSPDAGALDGTYVVPLDGSPRADCVLPIVAAWTVEFGGTPWLVEVVNESLLGAVDFVESAYVTRRAGELRQRITRDIEHEVLHGEHPARSIVDFASNERASLIFLSTHGRTGLARLWTGSVAAEVVRRALCPVILFRPPEPTVSDARSEVIGGRCRSAAGMVPGVVRAGGSRSSMIRPRHGRLLASSRCWRGERMGGRHVWMVCCAIALVPATAGCVDDDTDPSAAPPAELNEAGTRIELGPTELKVMTFNVWLGGALVDIGQVAAAIEAADADVVGLQESDGNARRIADLLGWAHADEQLQIISRYPLIAPPASDGYVYVQLAPGQVVGMANIHLPSDPYGPYLVRDGSDVDAVLANEVDTRVGALEELAAEWQSAFDDDIPLLLTGDFNAPSHRDWTDDTVGDRPHLAYAVDWPVSQAVEDLGFVDTFRDVHDNPHLVPGITWTFGYPYPRISDDEAQDRIDFVYAAGADEIVDSEIVGPEGAGDVSIGVDPYPSDHLGVVSTVVVDPAEPPVFVSAASPRTEVGVTDRRVLPRPRWPRHRSDRARAGREAIHRSTDSPRSTRPKPATSVGSHSAPEGVSQASTRPCW